MLIGIMLFLAAEIGFTLYKPDKLVAKVPFATLSIIGGNIQVQPKNSLTWERAKEGMPLEPGDRVRTLTDSRGFITFTQGTTTKLEPGTDLVLNDLENDEDEQPDKIMLEQRLGKTWTQVTERVDGKSYFQIQTSSANIKVHGTLFATEVDMEGNTTVKTTEGSVSVNAQGKEVFVPSGQQTIVEPGGAPSLPTPMPPAKNELVFSVDKDSAGLIVAPSGSKTGYLPDRKSINQIPGSQISSANGSTQTISIPEPETGEYKVVLQGAAGDKVSYSVEGFTNSQSTFVSSQSDNASSFNQTVLKLHVEVLDGLLKEIPGLNLMSEVKSETTTATSQPTAESSTIIDKSSRTRETGPNNKRDNGFSIGRGYSIGQWFILAVIIVFLGLGAVIIWRRI
jgi:hypothetical protein